MLMGARHQFGFGSLALLLAAVVACWGTASGQTTASGALNVQLLNGSGITLTFVSDSSGVTLSNAGTSAATLGFGTVGAFGSLSPGVTRPTSNSTSFTVSTIFDVNVAESGLTSTNYTLTAGLAAVAPTGLTYSIDSVTLTTTNQSIQTTGPYGSNVAHTLNVVVLTAAAGSGGPTVNTPLTTTINFTATAN